MDVAASPFPDDVLATNRDGRLTESQRRSLGIEERGRRRLALIGALFLLLFVAYIVFMPGIDPSGTTRYSFLVGSMVLAIALVYRSLFHVSSLARDLREGNVLSFEGALDKSRASEDDSDDDRRTYLVDIGDKGFSIDRAMYRAVFNGTYLRVFYLPHSSRVVSYEQLGHGAAVGGPSILSFFETLGTGVVSRNASVGEDVADIARPATGPVEQHVYQQPIAATEEGENPDETPSLAGAIAGTWTSPIMTITFGPDGIVDVVTIGGLKRWGHWSIDADGHLHSDVLGKNAVVGARVAGDQLTISLGATEAGLAFDRVVS